MKTILALFLLSAVVCNADPLIRLSPRWNCKVLFDADATSINFTPETTTVARLLQLPKLSPGPSVVRLAFEKKTFVVRGRIVSYKQEGDRDIHIVLTDPNDASKRMTVEIPDSSDKKAVKGGHATQFGSARRALNALFPGHPPNGKFYSPANPPLVEIFGVGYYDAPHYIIFKTEAPNNVELHPVLGLRSLK